MGTPRKHLNGALPTGCAQVAQHMVKLSTLPKKLSNFHRIASRQTGDQLYMLLMMLGVGKRRWTTRQNILHQANTMKYYALLTRPCLKVLLSSADNRGDSRSKEIHSRLGQKWEVQREQGDRARGRRPVLINLRIGKESLKK